MKNLVLALTVLVSIVVFSYCEAKDCVCSKWQDGVNSDPNPAFYTETDLENLNVRNCAGLNDYYANLGLAYDENKQEGIRCE